MRSTDRIRTMCLFIALLAFSANSYAQDVHERLIRIFSNMVGISDNHNGFVNFTPDQSINLYGTMTLFTERLKNQVFSLSGDFIPVRANFVNIAVGVHYWGTFSKIGPEFGIPLSFILHNRGQNLFLLVEPEPYWINSFRLDLNSEVLYRFRNTLFFSAGLRSNSYLPGSDSMFSLSAGVSDKILVSKVSYLMMDDFNFHQSLITLSAAVKFRK